MSSWECHIFARYPEPGRVKTRLAPTLSDTEACDLHRAALLATLELVRRFEASAEAGPAGCSPRILVTPDDRVGEMAALCGLNEQAVLPQGRGDLGSRLWRATSAAFERGASGVLLLGADSPTMPIDRLATAVEALRDVDIAIGGAHDGGYYLLGLTGPHGAVFERIDWGGEHVYRQTIERAETARLSIHRLPLWYDLDRPEDLVRALADLRSRADALPPAAAELAALLERITV